MNDLWFCSILHLWCAVFIDEVKGEDDLIHGMELKIVSVQVVNDILKAISLGSCLKTPINSNTELMWPK